MASKFQETTSSENAFDLKFWFSTPRVNCEEFSARLGNYMLPSWISSFQIKSFSNGINPNEIHEEIITSLDYNRQRQIHVVMIGDNQVESNCNEGHRNFMRVVKELASDFAFMGHHLIICNLSPSVRHYSLEKYRDILFEVTVGLNVILSTEIFATNLHLFNFERWLTNDDGEILSKQYYDPEMTAFNRVGHKKFINEIFDFIFGNIIKEDFLLNKK